MNNSPNYSKVKTTRSGFVRPGARHLGNGRDAWAGLRREIEAGVKYFWERRGGSPSTEIRFGKVRAEA